MKKIKTYQDFDIKTYSWCNNVDYRTNPELYKVGKGEQGVLICQPYKGEILTYWRFKTPAIAQESAERIWELFEKYLHNNDFVGADMARKFLQMGFTRSRRYANYKGGKKYKNDFETFDKNTGDPQKVKSAEIFYQAWQKAELHPKYKEMKEAWKKNYG